MTPLRIHGNHEKGRSSSILGIRRGGPDIGSPLKKRRIDHEKDPLPLGFIEGKIFQCLEVPDIVRLVKAFGENHRITNVSPRAVPPLQGLFQLDPRAVRQAVLLATDKFRYKEAQELLDHLRPSAKKSYDSSIPRMICELSHREDSPIDLFRRLIRTCKEYAPETYYPNDLERIIGDALYACFEKGHAEKAKILLSEFPFRPSGFGPAMYKPETLLNILHRQYRVTGKMKCLPEMVDILLTHFPIHVDRMGEYLGKILVIDHEEIPSLIKVLFKHYGANNKFIDQIVEVFNELEPKIPPKNSFAISRQLNPEQNMIFIDLRLNKLEL